jgi:hypothetical protein
LLIPYEQLFIETFHHNGNLITEQSTGEIKNHYFSWPSTPCLRQQKHENKNRSTRHPHTQISSNSSTIAADNSTGVHIIHYSIEIIAFSAEYTLSTTIVISV